MLVLQCRYAEERDAVRLGNSGPLVRAVGRTELGVALLVRRPTGARFELELKTSLVISGVRIRLLRSNGVWAKLGYEAPADVRIDRVKNIRRRERGEGLGR